MLRTWNNIYDSIHIYIKYLYIFLNLPTKNAHINVQRQIHSPKTRISFFASGTLRHSAIQKPFGPRKMHLHPAAAIAPDKRNYGYQHPGSPPCPSFTLEAGRPPVCRFLLIYEIEISLVLHHRKKEMNTWVCIYCWNKHCSLRWTCFVGISCLFHVVTIPQASFFVQDGFFSEKVERWLV